MIAAVALIIIAALLMVDGQILGEMTTSLSRILLITAISVIAKSKKSIASTDAQGASL
ncbi:MAG: hypothetical protein ACFE7R_09215 [Candidatus Hodarchaeota archaeon]